MNTSRLIVNKENIEIPEFILNDFETGVEGFVTGDNVVNIYTINSTISAPSPINGNYFLECDTAIVPGNQWRTISKTLANAIDVSRIPFFIGYVSSYGIDDSNIEMMITFYDVENQSFVETTSIVPNGWNKIKVDLSNWQYNTAIKRLDISFRSPTYIYDWNSRHQVDLIGFSSYYDWDFSVDGDFAGWATHNDLGAEVSNGHLLTNITGNDPFIANSSLYFDSEYVKFIKLRILNNTSGTVGAIYWATPLSGWDDIKSIEFPITSYDSEFKEYLIDLDAVDAWSGMIQDIRIDIPQIINNPAGDVSYDYISLSTRNEPVVGIINSIEATNESIIVSGAISCSTLKTLFLVELQPYENFDPNNYAPVSSIEITGQIFDYVFTIDRYYEQKDRIYSKYIAVADGIPLGLPQYVTIYPKAENVYPYPNIPSIKGLQVQMVDDANLLGVNHAGLNCNINEIFYKDAFVQPDNIIPYEYEGETYYFNKGTITGLDIQIKALTDDKAIVTLILIFWGQILSPDYPYEITRHPDYIDGNIAAINTTDKTGTKYWKAVCEFIAARYTRADQMYGRAVNFVIGNEICVAGLWNDMGYKQINEYIDQYTRTFRIAFTAIMKHYSEARVHISLDHHWNSSFDSEQPLRSYNGKDTTDFVNSQIALQGNIPWCMAFHPYPSDLNDSYIWNDPVPTDDFYTAKITFKNLHIMPEYLKQDQFLNNGKLRSISLTEQGFDTTDPYNMNDQMVQAAAYCYAYYKAKFTDGIDAFIYHRHVDFTGEMMWVGLWNNVQNSTIPNEPYQKKYIYSVFQKIDTIESLNVSSFALPIIEINDWSEVIPNFDANLLGDMPISLEMDINIAADIAPSAYISDFESSLDGWREGENSLLITRVPEFQNPPSVPYQGNYALENNFKLHLENGGARAHVGITKIYETPININETPVLQFAITADYLDISNYKVTVVVYSGYNKIIGTGILTPKLWNAMKMNLSNWYYKNSVDKIKIWLSTDSQIEINDVYHIDYIGFGV